MRERNLFALDSETGLRNERNTKRTRTYTSSLQHVRSRTGGSIATPSARFGSSDNRSSAACRAAWVKRVLAACVWSQFNFGARTTKFAALVRSVFVRSLVSPFCFDVFVRRARLKTKLKIAKISKIPIEFECVSSVSVCFVCVRVQQQVPSKK